MTIDLISNTVHNIVRVSPSISLGNPNGLPWMLHPHVIVNRVGPLAHVAAVGTLVARRCVHALVFVVPVHGVALREGTLALALGTVKLSSGRIVSRLDEFPRRSTFRLLLPVGSLLW